MAQAPIQAPAPLILLSPWEGDIDLSSKTGKSLWDKGIKPLNTKFTGYAKDLVRFMADVKNCADKCKWDDILLIHGKHLLKQYGEITADQVKNARDTRIQAVPTMLEEACPQVNGRMMFYFMTA